MRWYGCAGRQYATNGRKRRFGILAVFSNRIPKCWRTERLRWTPVVGVLQNKIRIDVCGSREIHFRKDRSHAHRAVEQAKQRKAGQIDLAGLYAIAVSNLTHLVRKVSVAIEDTFRRPRTPRGENNGRRVVVA